MRAPPDSSDVDISSFFPSTIEENAVLNNSLRIISEQRSQSSKLKRKYSETKKTSKRYHQSIWTECSVARLPDQPIQQKRNGKK